jgi:dTDP-4-dehydrorhamnose reductase
MRVLITGADGQLGQAFKSSIPLSKSLGIELVFADRTRLDITQPEKITRFFQQNSFNAVVNTAAYTSVDRAESEPELARLINEYGPKLLAQHCHQQQLTFVHISTDYVFNGRSSAPYAENDPVSPLGVYGKTKYAGEVAVLAQCPSAIILRTSWVFSEFGYNFLKTMLRLAKDRSQLSVGDDHWGAPTYAPHIAETILHVLNPKKKSINSGVYHLSGDQKTNWQQFAVYIFEQQRSYDAEFQAPEVLPISTEQYPTAAARPANSQLNNHKLLQLLPELKCNWQQGVARSIKALQGK